VSGLSAGGSAGQLLKTQAIHGLGVERVFLPDMFRNPNKGWPVEYTPLVITDGGGGSGCARVFPPDVASGVAFHLWIPEGATQVHVRIPHRARFASETGVMIAPRLYARISDDREWSGPMALGTVHLPPNNLYQATTLPILLSPFKLKATDYAQFLFVRYPMSRSDTLESDWLLFGLGVTFV